MKKRRVCIRVFVFLVLFFAAAVTGFRYYAADYYPATAYTPVTELTEETGDYIVYGDKASRQGLIFYPGAKIETAAYAPILDELAQAGICCVAVKMPYHLAIFDSGAAGDVMQEFQEVQEWYIGGHSLGGAMAAGYAAEYAEEFTGLILLAAYPTDTLEELPVLSLYGSEDAILNWEKYENAIPLAKNLTERVIEGGNHAGFGNYGLQKGEGYTELPHEEQWQETVDYILNFMQACSDKTK